MTRAFIELTQSTNTDKKIPHMKWTADISQLQRSNQRQTHRLRFLQKMYGSLVSKMIISQIWWSVICRQTRSLAGSKFPPQSPDRHSKWWISSTDFSAMEMNYLMEFWIGLTASQRNVRESVRLFICAHVCLAGAETLKLILTFLINDERWQLHSPDSSALLHGWIAAYLWMFKHASHDHTWPS